MQLFKDQNYLWTGTCSTDRIIFNVLIFLSKNFYPCCLVPNLYLTQAIFLVCFEHHRLQSHSIIQATTYYVQGRHAIFCSDSQVKAKSTCNYSYWWRFYAYGVISVHLLRSLQRLPRKSCRFPQRRKRSPQGIKSMPRQTGLLKKRLEVSW